MHRTSRDMSSPADVPRAERPPLVAHHPLDVAQPVRDPGITLLVSVQRDDLASRAEPDLQLPVEQPKQFDSYASLEPYDHRLLPRYFAPDSMPPMMSCLS